MFRVLRPAARCTLAASACAPTTLRCRLAASAATQAAPTCPWSILGVQRGADLDECKDAFRQLALTLHPDVGGEPERFAAVVAAWEEISLAALASEARARPRGLRGVRNVDGVLLVSVDQLKSDPLYEVHTLRIALQGPDDDAPSDSGRGGGRGDSGNVCSSSSDSGDRAGCDGSGSNDDSTPDHGGGPRGDAGVALGTERVHLVHTTPYDSIADFCDVVDVQVSLT